MPNLDLGAHLDLRPHPRILPMLGEITLAQWRCIAELVDNSIDGFLHAQRLSKSIEAPEVHISLPAVDQDSARVTVRDNGPGMSLEVLENAVRAGWTGNDPINNLGLFGMGFNIATAKLGRATTVWTTRAGDSEWNGVRIDFDELSRQGHFETPRLSRPKVQTNEHGTEVVVESLKPDQRQWFAKTSNRSQLSRNLAEAYSTMLLQGGHPIEFALLVNNVRVSGFEHCVWGSHGSPTRSVQLSPPTGLVETFQPIDVQLQPRSYCTACWQWLPLDTQICPSCRSNMSVVQRERRIYGWIGLQRYLHESEFGLDILRNGRKIEVRSKELFEWTNDDGTVEKEYPIDDHRRLGRIVGEIHIDHCRVSYTKDRFDRTDPAWEEMLFAVRGEGPLRPEIAKEKGYSAVNTSPLFRLYQAFRRSSPYKKVAGCYSKLVLVPVDHNPRAQEMARRFRSGDPGYLSDAEWWGLVEEADRALLTGTSTGSTTGGGTTTGGEPPSPVLPGFSGTPTSPGIAPSTPVAPVVAQRRSIKSLTDEYREPLTSEQFRVAAYEAIADDPLLQHARPWAFVAQPTGTYDFVIDLKHEVFRSLTFTPIDALLSELSWVIMDHQRGVQGAYPYAHILTNLRKLHAVSSRLDVDEMSGRAGRLLNDIGSRLAQSISEDDAKAIFDSLTESEQTELLQRMVTRGITAVQGLLLDGQFARYLSPNTVVRLFARNPELFFDGRCWPEAYMTLDLVSASVTDQARTERVRYFTGLLLDAVWLASCDGPTLRDADRERLVRSAMALELLEPDAE